MEALGSPRRVLVKKEEEKRQERHKRHKDHNITQQVQHGGNIYRIGKPPKLYGWRCVQVRDNHTCDTHTVIVL